MDLAGPDEIVHQALEGPPQAHYRWLHYLIWAIAGASLSVAVQSAFEMSWAVAITASCLTISFGLLAAILSRHAQESCLAHLHSEWRGIDPDRYPGLIVLLGPYRQLGGLTEEEDRIHKKFQSLTDVSSADAEVLETVILTSNLAPPVEAISYHLSDPAYPDRQPLKYVWGIVSEKTPGAPEVPHSEETFNIISTWFRHQFDGKLPFDFEAIPVKADKYEQIAHEVRAIYRDRRIPADQIVLDFTGMKKPMSLAAAGAAANMGGHLQYCDIRRDWTGEPLAGEQIQVVMLEAQAMRAFVHAKDLPPQ